MVPELFDYPFEEKAKGLLIQAKQDPDSSFRSDQLESIIKVTKDRKKLLLVKRTGWGKSMVYFIATKILRDPDYYESYLGQENVNPGPALMISPLISLMRNQVKQAEKFLDIQNYDSTLTSAQKIELEEKFLNSEVDLLLISPERLSNLEFMENVLRPMASKISLLIVDEAHCISDWGHDFRPDYMRIKSIISGLPSNTPLMATTATANQRVMEDVVDQFGGDIEVSRGNLARTSIHLDARILPSQEERLAFIAQEIPKMQSSGIVYTSTVRQSHRVSNWLKSQGIRAEAYHAKLDPQERIEIENRLLNDDIKVAVATTALSMGFDKPNLGFVFHFNTPQSTVHYYQQVGRAGRALPKAFGVCLNGLEDEDINRFFIEKAYPEENTFKVILEVLEETREELSLSEIEDQVNCSRKKIEAALKIMNSLEESPVIQVSQNRWQRTINPLKINWSEVEKIKERRLFEWQEMKNYVKKDNCLMKFLEDSLDDENPSNCGRCSVCTNLDTSFGDIARDLILEATGFLKRLNIPLEPRKLWLKPRFSCWPEFNGSIRNEHQIERGRVLCHYSDQLYGTEVRDGKKDGYFDEELVDASVELICNKWDLKDKVQWVTCVPSLTNPDLVPELARRVAYKLDLNFLEAIIKVRETESQKSMENSGHKKRNLDGAFEIDSNLIQKGPVLLIDDVVDSKWTFTIIGALLRKAQVSKVYPFALAYLDNSGQNVKDLPDDFF